MAEGPADTTPDPEDDDTTLLDHALSCTDEYIRVTMCDDLAHRLWTQWQASKDTSKLAMYIRAHTELLRLHPPGHPDRARRCLNLASSKRAQFDWMEDLTTLEEAVLLEREALTLRPVGHPDRASTCAQLAISLHATYKNTGASTLLSEAIEIEQEVLDLLPPDSPRRATACTNLAISLKARFGQTGQRALLEEAMQLEREALALRPVGHPHRARSCVNLAVPLHVMYMESGDVRLLEEAIHLKREALRLRPPMHAQHSYSCSTLAVSLTTLFERTGEASLLDEVIQLLREALVLQPVGHRNRARISEHLAASLGTRFDQTGDRTLLDEAILIEQQVLALRPALHPSRPAACASLAILLNKLFAHTGDAELLDKIGELKREALRLRPHGHPKRAASCSSLAVSLTQQFEHNSNYELLDQAIQFDREALALLSIGSPVRAASCTNLALSLRYLFKRRTAECYTEDRSILTEARNLLREALLMRPPGHPERWRSLLQLSELALLRQDNIAAARHLSDALDSPTHALVELLHAALSVIDRMGTKLAFPHLSSALVKCYSTALELLIISSSFALDRSTQLRHLLHTSSISSGILILAKDANELQVGLQLLEYARGVIWSQALNMRDLHLENVPIHLATKLQELAYGMYTNPRPQLHQADPSQPHPFLPPRDLMYEQRSQLQQTLREIRMLPGMEDFMGGLSYRALLGAATWNPVVVLVADKVECHALIIPSSREQLIYLALPLINIETLQTSAFTHERSRKRGLELDVEDASRLAMGIHKKATASCSILEKLWYAVVKPIVTRLGISKTKHQTRLRLHWCPTGAFAFVPVHAAGVYDGPDQESCSDYVVSSYAPTLTALVRAQRGANAYPIEQTGLVLIAAERAHNMTLPLLHYVPQEVKNVVEAATFASISSSLYSGCSTLGSLSPAGMIHFACHGIQDPTEPHRSHFSLADGDLTVEKLMDADLGHTFFAFLSACETAKGDPKHADEVVHLAATMLFAGLKSIVATMWAMNDRDGPYVAKLFYKKLFDARTLSVDGIPQALDYAVASLRASGASPERWATFVHIGA